MRDLLYHYASEAGRKGIVENNNLRIFGASGDLTKRKLLLVCITSHVRKQQED
jgi:glucose-6-phosphate 1-dehydrogenase